LELTKSFLNIQISKAEEEKNKNSKLYKTLGITIGLAIVIVLI
jgi:stage III sporulation protein AB